MPNHLLDISLFKRNRNFALLYLGQFISFIGTMITFVALPYQVYALTQSTTQVGFLSLVQLLPLTITALIGGALADRYNRRRLIIISEILLVLGCGWLAYNAFQTHPSVIGLFIVSALMSAITGIHRPAFDSITQQLVDPGDYKAMGALVSFKWSFCMIVGPALAGLMIAQYDIAFTYLIDLATFFVSILTLIFMRHVPKPINSEHEKILPALKSGLQFAVSKQELLGSYLVDFIAMIFAMPNALFPAIAQNFGGVKTLGFLYAAPAVGSLIISFISGWTLNIKSSGKTISIAAILWGAAIIGFGLSPSLYFALFFLMLSGAFDTISAIFRITLWNHVIPQEKRGRLAGIEMISYLSGPRLGDTRAGLVASFFGITTAITSGGILCIFGVAVCCFYMPKFWNYKE